MRSLVSITTKKTDPITVMFGDKIKTIDRHGETYTGRVVYDADGFLGVFFDVDKRIIHPQRPSKDRRVNLSDCVSYVGPAQVVVNGHTYNWAEVLGTAVENAVVDRTVTRGEVVLLCGDMPFLVTDTGMVDLRTGRKDGDLAANEWMNTMTDDQCKQSTVYASAEEYFRLRR